jgi:hypothetical protein
MRASARVGFHGVFDLHWLIRQANTPTSGKAGTFAVPPIVY